MPIYRLFKLGQDGHIAGLATTQETEHDDLAMAEAGKLSALNDCAIEVWNRDRMVGRYPPLVGRGTETSTVLKIR